MRRVHTFSTFAWDTLRLWVDGGWRWRRPTSQSPWWDAWRSAGGWPAPARHLEALLRAPRGPSWGPIVRVFHCVGPPAHCSFQTEVLWAIPRLQPSLFGGRYHRRSNAGGYLSRSALGKMHLLRPPWRRRFRRMVDEGFCRDHHFGYAPTLARATPPSTRAPPPPSTALSTIGTTVHPARACTVHPTRR